MILETASYLFHIPGNPIYFLQSPLPVRVINLYLNNVGNPQHPDLKGSPRKASEKITFTKSINSDLKYLAFQVNLVM